MTNPYRKLSKDNRPALTSTAKRASKEEQKKEALRKRMAERRRLAARKRAKFQDNVDEQLFDESGEFNPQVYDYSRQAKNNRRMFDKQGNTNAWDDRDALVQANHLFNHVTKKNANRLSMYNPDAPSEKMSREAKMKIMAAALNDPTGAGFHMVGQELALPIKAILDYEGFSRKIYRTRKLAQGELFRIPKDVRATAWEVGQDGMSYESRMKTTWITPNEFKVTSFPTVDVLDIYHMNFDVLERAQDTARQEIMLQEDKAGITLIDRAARTDSETTTFASLGVGPFEDVRYQVERHRLFVTNFLVNRAEVSDVVKTMSANVDPVTERELLLAGYVGTFMNAEIITAAGVADQEVIPAGTFYAVASPDYLGEMAIRAELISEPYNKYPLQETVKGWAFYEIVGFGIPNSRSAAKGQK